MSLADRPSSRKPRLAIGARSATNRWRRNEPSCQRAQNRRTVEVSRQAPERLSESDSRARNRTKGESHGRTTIQRHPSNRAGGTRRRGKDQPCRSDAVRSRRHRPIGVDGQRLQHRRFEPRSAPARRLDRAQPLQFRISRRRFRDPRRAPARSALPPTARRRSRSPTSPSSSSIPTRPAPRSPRRRCARSTSSASRTSSSSTASTRRTAASATCCRRSSR